MREEPPSPSFPGEGKLQWRAVRPDGSRFEDDDPWSPPRRGSVIRLMGDDSVEIPLWDEDGLMFVTADEVVAELGVTATLAADLAAWGTAWQHRSREPGHDVEAARLVRRLNDELGGRYQFVYRP